MLYLVIYTGCYKKVWHQQPRRLRSTRSFLLTSEPIEVTAEERSLHLWKEETPNPTLALKKQLAAGGDKSFATCKTLDRLRTGSQIASSTFTDGATSTGDLCGIVQTDDYLLTCPNLSICCTPLDLQLANDKGI